MNLHPDDIDRAILLMTRHLVCDRGNLAEAVMAVASALGDIAAALEDVHDEIAKWDIEVGEKADGEEPAP